MSWPMTVAVPAAGFNSPTATRPSVDLPDPDSPTRPRTSFGPTERST